jgi:starch synthase
LAARVLLAASEVVGFAKTGGLADVAGSLPRALARLGHDVAVVMPLYRAVRTGKHRIEKTDIVLAVPIGGHVLACRLFRGTLPGSDVPVYFVEAPHYFERDDPATGKGIYQQAMPNGYKADYPDNAERFTFFSRAVLEAVPHVGFVPDVLHANDWQTGLVPVFAAEAYRGKLGYETLKTVFTIHNIAYQGMFGRDVMSLTALPGYLFNHKQLEFHGHFNFLKAGIVYADAVNTVSPTYSREIQTAEYGCGLEGLLGEQKHKLSGIVNGVDYGEWNPAIDSHLPMKYDAETVGPGKAAAKAELQKRMSIPVDPNRPVLGLVARLVSQKGIDLVTAAAPGFLDLGCQIVFLGDGDPEFHNELQQFRDKHPDRVGIFLGFNETLAHLVEAGSDLFLMPSRYEPSGLNQLYSLKYGTPPVVRQTGGLADTIVSATEENLAAGTATGFSFEAYTAHALYETVKWALKLFRERPADFQQVVRTAMGMDWSWTRSARQYAELYQRIA